MSEKEIRDAIDYFERLKVYAAEYEKEYPESKQAPEKIDLAIAALRAQIEPGWINVSERLPEIYQQDNGEPMEFIVMIKGAIVPTVLSYNGTEWFQMDWTNTRAGSSYAVTHWMPLPEPPKEDQ